MSSPTSPSLLGRCNVNVKYEKGSLCLGALPDGPGFEALMESAEALRQTLAKHRQEVLDSEVPCVKGESATKLSWMLIQILEDDSMDAGRAALAAQSGLGLGRFQVSLVREALERAVELEKQATESRGRALECARVAHGALASVHGSLDRVLRVAGACLGKCEWEEADGGGREKKSWLLHSLGTLLSTHLRAFIHAHNAYQGAAGKAAALGAGCSRTLAALGSTLSHCTTTKQSDPSPEEGPSLLPWMAEALGTLARIMAIHGDVCREVEAAGGVLDAAQQGLVGMEVLWGQLLELAGEALVDLQSHKEGEVSDVMEEERGGEEEEEEEVGEEEKGGEEVVKLGGVPPPRIVQGVENRVGFLLGSLCTLSAALSNGEKDWGVYTDMLGATHTTLSEVSQGVIEWVKGVVPPTFPMTPRRPPPPPPKTQQQQQQQPQLRQQQQPQQLVRMHQQAQESPGSVSGSGSVPSSLLNHPLLGVIQGLRRQCASGTLQNRGSREKCAEAASRYASTVALLEHRVGSNFYEEESKGWEEGQAAFQGEDGTLTSLPHLRSTAAQVAKLYLLSPPPLPPSLPPPPMPSLLPLAPDEREGGQEEVATMVFSGQIKAFPATPSSTPILPSPNPKQQQQQQKQKQQVLLPSTPNPASTSCAPLPPPPPPLITTTPKLATTTVTPMKFLSSLALLPHSRAPSHATPTLAALALFPALRTLLPPLSLPSHHSLGVLHSHGRPSWHRRSPTLIRHATEGLTPSEHAAIAIELATTTPKELARVARSGFPPHLEPLRTALGEALLMVEASRHILTSLPCLSALAHLPYAALRGDPLVVGGGGSGGFNSGATSSGSSSFKNPPTTTPCTSLLTSVLGAMMLLALPPTPIPTSPTKGGGGGGGGGSGRGGGINPSSVIASLPLPRGTSTSSTSTPLLLTAFPPSPASRINPSGLLQDPFSLCISLAFSATSGGNAASAAAASAQPSLRSPLLGGVSGWEGTLETPLGEALETLRVASRVEVAIECAEAHLAHMAAGRRGLIVGRNEVEERDAARVAEGVGRLRERRRALCALLPALQASLDTHTAQRAPVLDRAASVLLFHSGGGGGWGKEEGDSTPIPLPALTLAFPYLGVLRAHLAALINAERAAAQLTGAVLNYSADLLGVHCYVHEKPRPPPHLVPPPASSAATPRGGVAATAAAVTARKSGAVYNPPPPPFSHTAAAAAAAATPLHQRPDVKRAMASTERFLHRYTPGTPSRLPGVPAALLPGRQ